MITSGSRQKENYIGFFGGYKATKVELSLSNWYPSYFLMYLGSKHQKELSFNCSEQAVMYIKSYIFKDYDTADKIKRASYNPKLYKRLGREATGFDDKVWKSVRESVYEKVLWQKFGQNKEIRDYLLSTSNNILVECNPYDKVWGIGLSLDDDFSKKSNWRGSNLLGNALMKVRQQFREVGVN